MGAGFLFTRKEDRVSARTPEQQQEFLSTLPEFPSDDRIVIMARDSHVIFAYFGFDERTKEKIRQIYGNKAPAVIELKKEGKGLISSLII